jgi:hypothetical protein
MRRVKPAQRRSCARVGGRVARSLSDPSGLACIVSHSGVPYEVVTGRVDRNYARYEREGCRSLQRQAREGAQYLADARHRAIRTDLFIWHPRTRICETRLKGQLVRPR